MSNMHMNTTMTMTTNKPLLRHIEYSDPTPNTNTKTKTDVFPVKYNSNTNVTNVFVNKPPRPLRPWQRMIKLADIDNLNVFINHSVNDKNVFRLNFVNDFANDFVNKPLGDEIVKNRAILISRRVRVLLKDIDNA